MSLCVRHLIGLVLMSTTLVACSTSVGTINTPIGELQLGMELEEVGDILGAGTVVKPLEVRGKYSTEMRSYPKSDGRIYLVHYVDNIVRRWELRDRVTTESQ